MPKLRDAIILKMMNLMYKKVLKITCSC